ncbi:MAG: hypothetical protein H0T44_00565 [Gemmatimonadales bacterium]|nr:hypothetical protein [Gemmatimonadales bacterium]MDQ3427591.1 hypothetical protein [Gemmatimonadota bacterium]
MCYFLHLATPLTLSEVRSMLPAGLSAHAVDSAERAVLRELHPAGQSVLRLLVGACSCDLVRSRGASPREDERDLRERYRRLGLSREATLSALDIHRSGAARRIEPRDGWPSAVAAFVAEHARNAGPTLYFLGFSPVPRLTLSSPPGRLVAWTVADVRGRPDAWLTESRPTLVT